MHFKKAEGIVNGFVDTIAELAAEKVLKKLADEKRISRYEVTSLMAHAEDVDEKLKKMQDDGWEIAGDILNKNKSGHCTDTFLYIPMKRKF